MKIIELREYQIKSGKKQEWLEWLRNELLPYQRSKGMIIIDTYIRTDDDGIDYFVWLREFKNEKSRQEIYKNTYDEKWIKEIRPKVFTLIDEDSIHVKILEPIKM